MNKLSNITFICITALCCCLTQARAAAQSVCATVKIEIAQEMTLERQAFDAHMRINNGMPESELTNVKVEVLFTDENGNSVLATTDPTNTAAKFFFRISSLQNISDVSGTGKVAASTSADIRWLIIPATGAANSNLQGALYYVGATLYYRLGNEDKKVEVIPDYIRVKPMPELALDYFLPVDVYGDDPFTDPIEPTVPFTLGVRVKNSGNGTARSVKIDSAQPKIVENELGLLINFWIMETWMNEQRFPDSLLINFGDIPAHTSKMGRWIMGVTLSGKFTEFTASYSHSDELGGQVTSLINALNTHTLVRDVLVDLAGSDTVRDFLANDAGIYKVYESDDIDSEVYDESAQAELMPQGSTGTKDVYTLTMPATAGFVYVKLPDPLSGNKIIARATRSDGKNIRLENAWLSKTWNRNTQNWDYYFNLFDADSTGRYTIEFVNATDVNQPPVLQFIENKSEVEKKQISFLVEASDPDGTFPSLSAAPLPAGAVFSDNGNGTGLFDWTPQEGQAGKYEVKFSASDGVFEDSQAVMITVKPAVNPLRDFSLTLSPSSKTITQGETVSYILNIQGIEGFDSPVSLVPTVSPQPSQGSINLSIPSPVTPNPSASAELTVNATEDLQPGEYSISLRASGEDKTHSVSSGLIIEEKFGITTASLPTGRVGENYTKALASKAGVAPYSWSISSGALPDGLTLDTSTGVISGTPAEKGYFIFTVEAKDSSNPFKTCAKEFSIIIWPQPTEAFGEGALLKVSATTVIDAEGIVLLFKDGYKEVYSFADAKINNTALKDMYGIFTTPLIKFPIYKGDEWTINEVKYKVLKTDEAVSVLAGTFKDCVKLEETISVPAQTIIRWFAPRIGIIKAQINWSDGSVSTGQLKQYSVADPGNNDYFPLKKNNYWIFEWDNYKSIVHLTEKYTITEFDSNVISARLKNPWVSVNDLFPYPNQGITDTTRVPCDSSVIGRIQSSLGLEEEKLVMRIKSDGTQFYTIPAFIKQAGLGKANDYWVSFNKPRGISSSLTADTLTDTTASWIEGSLIGMSLNPNLDQEAVFPIINNTATSITVNGDMSLSAKAGDTYQALFTHGNIADARLSAQDVSGNTLSAYDYSFKTESQLQHDTAKQELPITALDISNPNEYVLSINSEKLLEGAKIKYSPDEPIAPKFGPLDEIPKLDIALGIGLPLNLEPAAVFRKPVTLILPCPGAADLANLEIYGYHPVLGWRLASEIDGWIVPHSRINHPETATPTIEFQVFHFTGVQIGKPISSVSIYSNAASYNNGIHENSLNVDITADFADNSISGSMEFYAINKTRTINMKSTLIKEIKHGSNGEATIKGDCKINDLDGYAFTAILSDIDKPGKDKDFFSIEITGPAGFKFSVTKKKITEGDIEITWQ